MAPQPPPPELLSPAGNWDCARAAVENGADAIYFGLTEGLNARARADNFSVSDLSDLMEFLHLRGVRGYVTLNTLVFSDELQRVEEHAIAMSQAGVDAVLVQDLGAAGLIRSVCPDLELHASTQMTLSSTSGIELASQLGLRRVVLPRELSLDEMNRISLEDSPVELEAFVHGALCVAYSGQCLTSESLGGRSANRGQCAQACRLPYEVICDGQDVELGDVQYLLSPQDLAAHALIPELLDAGVHSFKIEGRLKTPEYVANVTKHYRMALDAAMEGRSFALDAKQVEELELSFSRGFSVGWLGGCDHKMLVPGLSSAKQGIRVGRVRTVRGKRVVVQLEKSLRVGDGVAFAGDRIRGTETGGRIFALYRERGDERIRDAVERGIVELEFHGDSIDLTCLRGGQEVWKTDDPKLTQRLRATFSGRDAIRRVPVDLRVKATAGKPLEVTAKADNGRSCRVRSEDVLPVAKKHPASVETVRDKLQRLGDSVYALRGLDLKQSGSPMVPHSVLGEVRRKLIDSLSQGESVEGGSRESNTYPSRLEPLRSQAKSITAQATETQTKLHVMCRNMDQVTAVAELSDSIVGDVYVDFADIREYRDAADFGREHGLPVYLATPRIEKPGETGIFTAMMKHQPAGVLVRNLGGLSFFRSRNIPCVADFSLNAANELTVARLMDWGSQRVTASYDLNREQMRDLVAALDGKSLEVVVHQHMPMFHMEHCVFCAVLSPGTNKTNCGRPCDDHVVHLRDRVGAEHPLHADVGCRNTLFNAVPQSAAEMVRGLTENGVRHLRVELLEENAADAQKIVSCYHQLLSGELTGEEVWRQLKATNRVGVTRGTMEAGRDPLAII